MLSLVIFLPPCFGFRGLETLVKANSVSDGVKGVGVGGVLGNRSPLPSWSFYVTFSTYKWYLIQS